MSPTTSAIRTAPLVALLFAGFCNVLAASMSQNAYERYKNSEHRTSPEDWDAYFRARHGYVEELVLAGRFGKAATILEDEMARLQSLNLCEKEGSLLRVVAFRDVLLQTAWVAAMSHRRKLFDRAFEELQRRNMSLERVAGQQPWDLFMEIKRYDAAFTAYKENLSKSPGYFNANDMALFTEILQGWIRMPRRPPLKCSRLRLRLDPNWMVEHPVDRFVVLEEKAPEGTPFNPMRLGSEGENLLVSLPKGIDNGEPQPDQVVLEVTVHAAFQRPTMVAHPVNGDWGEDASWLFRNEHTLWQTPGGDYGSVPVGEAVYRWSPPSSDTPSWAKYTLDITDFWNATRDQPSASLLLKLAKQSTCGSDEITVFRPGSESPPVIREYISTRNGFLPVGAQEVAADPRETYLDGADALERGYYGAALASWTASARLITVGSLQNTIQSQISIVKSFLKTHRWTDQPNADVYSSNNASIEPGIATKESPRPTSVAEPVPDKSPNTSPALHHFLQSMAGLSAASADERLASLRSMYQLQISTRSFDDLPIWRYQTALITLCKDTDQRVREVAAQNMILFNDKTADANAPRMAQALVTALNDPSTEVRVAASESLAGFEQEAGFAKGPLIRLLNDPNPRLRQAAIVGLSFVGRNDPSNFSRLVEMLHDDEPQVRSQALRSLWLYKTSHPEYEGYVQEAQKDSNGDVRSTARYLIQRLSQVRKH